MDDKQSFWAITKCEHCYCLPMEGIGVGMSYKSHRKCCKCGEKMADEFLDKQAKALPSEDKGQWEKILKTELEMLKEKAWKYDDLCK